MQNLSDNPEKRISGWWSRLTPYQRFAFMVATAAWMFDCLDQQIFNLARPSAMKALAVAGQDPKAWGNYATSIFLMGWATGGMIFGSLGDRYGRAKMLALSVALYAVATGFSALSVHVFDFCVYRFITGLGVGGVFGLAVALVADSVSNDVRPRALGVLQSFSAVGNIGGGLIGLGVAMFMAGPGSWKWLFLIGALPALLTAGFQFKLKEPQAWIESRDKALAAGRKPGSYKELFGSPTWRRHALLGVLLSCAGVIGLWGIGVFSNDMVSEIIGRNLKAAGKSAAKIDEGKQLWTSINLLCFNAGGYVGMLAFTHVTERFGRRKTFAWFFLGALLSTVFAYQRINQTSDILWMTPVMGFFQLSVFAGFSIYLPELFPTRLRSTGTSFCYNVGRYLAATGPFTLSILQTNLGASAQAKAVKALASDATQAVIEAAKTTAKIDAFRNAASLMCVVFLLGIVVLPFLPETKGQPLPED
jgi:MFS family permease